MAPFIATVFSLEDCCFEATTSGGTVCLFSPAFLYHRRLRCFGCALTVVAAIQSLKYRSNAQEGVFYDVPQNENDGSGSFCGLKITR